MAIDPSALYGSQVDTSDSIGYPQGKARGDTVDGDGTGTPLHQDWVSDLWGFEQALLDEAGLSPSGNPDKVGASQYVEGVRSVASNVVRGLRLANWSATDEFMADQDELRAVAYAAGVFVAVGKFSSADRAAAYTSTNGLDWVDREVTDAEGDGFNGLAFNGSVFVAVGDSGRIHTSAAGVTWVRRTPAASYTGDFRAVAWAQSIALFCAVGDDGEIQTSPDGTTWTKRTQAGAYAGDFRGVAWSSSLSLFVAVGTGGQIQTSPNGTTWTARTPAASFAGAFNGVAWSSDSSLFVAVGASGTIQTSPDGTAWTARTSGTTSELQCAAAADETILVGGPAGAAILSSPDGITWTNRNRAASLSLQPVVFTPGSVRGFAFDGRWVAVGYGSRALASLSLA